MTGWEEKKLVFHPQLIFHPHPLQRISQWLHIIMQPNVSLPVMLQSVWIYMDQNILVCIFKSCTKRRDMHWDILKEKRRAPWWTVRTQHQRRWEERSQPRDKLEGAVARVIKMNNTFISSVKTKITTAAAELNIASPLLHAKLQSNWLKIKLKCQDD